MNILTKEKWYRFKPDGRLFEELVQELLNVMYPNADFKHTTWSWDGGKDFESGIPFFDEEFKVWAECKYHQTSLPIHEVSMTLFMAYIESVDIILFFSYSPVNSEFHKYIDLFKKKNNKKIKIFADCSLEKLIIENKERFNFESYFDEITIDKSYDIDGIKYRYWIHNSNRKSNNIISFYMNDIITLEFSAMNLGQTAVDIQLEIIFSNGDKWFEILDKEIVKNNLKINLTVPPNGICGKTIELKIDKYYPILKLPTIRTLYDGISEVHRIKKRLECHWLAETPIIGEKYKNTLKNWEKRLTNENNVYGAIVGRSGTGKSRILQEINAIAKYEGYRVIYFDADKTNSLDSLFFFRKLISIVEEIPYTHKLSNYKLNYIYEQLEKDNNEVAVILKILSQDKLNLDDIKDQLISYIINILNKNNYIFILDNIQFYDELILEIFQYIMDSCDLHSNSKILYAANSDYTYKDSYADQIIRKIKCFSSKEPKFFLYHELTGYKEKEAYLYLKNCLTYNSNSSNYDNFEYSNSIEKIVSKYGTNPLFLQNYILYLMQQNIIEKTETSSFYITDCDKFKESIKKIPSSLLDLLSAREQTFVEYITRYSSTNSSEVRKNYALLVSFIGFNKWLPLKVIKKLTSIPLDIIKEMIHVGILKINNEGFYGFYHQEIEYYYKDRYPYTQLSDKNLELYIKVTSQEYNSSLYSESIFLAEYELNKVQDKTFNKIINNILLKKLNYSNTYAICKAVSVLLNNKYNVPVKKYIKLYTYMTNICINRVGLKYTQSIYEDIYYHFIEEYDYFSQELWDSISILRAYIRCLLNLHKVEESLKKDQELLNIIDNYFRDNKNYTVLLIELYYIQIYAYNKINDIEQSIQICNKCINLSKRINSSKYIIQSWFTKGDTYYTYKLSYKYSEQIIECWNNAWHLYQELIQNKQDSCIGIDLKINLLIRNTLVMIFQENPQKAYINAKEISKYFDKTQMVYFEIKMRLLYVLTSIYFEKSEMLSSKSYEKLEALLKKSIDICAVYGNETLYFDCFHLLAILQRRYGQWDFSNDNYKKSFNILKRILNNQLSVDRWSYFLYDMVIAFRDTNSKNAIPPHIWNLIDKDDEQQHILLELTNISEEKYKQFIENMEPISLPYDHENHIYFPKI